MSIKVSVIAPVKNEAQFIGYSIMAVLPYVHEIIYSCAKSDDGTDELLNYVKDKYAKEKLVILRKPEYDFNVHDMTAYNRAYNDCIERATGEAVFFLHPDMIVTNPEKFMSLPESTAWWTNLTSYARDFDTVISCGRATKWKNIHRKQLGLHYYGGYGSQNEDFYHKHITGNSYVHHGEDFKKYPFRVSDSGLQVNHYCELKDYKRRFEKMKSCLKTLYPEMNEVSLEEMAANHPRVTLEKSSQIFGSFDFQKTTVPAPEVFNRYRDEFSRFDRKMAVTSA